MGPFEGEDHLILDPLKDDDHDDHNDERDSESSLAVSYVRSLDGKLIFTVCARCLDAGVLTRRQRPRRKPKSQEQTMIVRS